MILPEKWQNVCKRKNNCRQSRTPKRYFYFMRDNMLFKRFNTLRSGFTIRSSVAVRHDWSGEIKLFQLKNTWKTRLINKRIGNTEKLEIRNRTYLPPMTWAGHRKMQQRRANLITTTATTYCVLKKKRNRIRKFQKERTTVGIDSKIGCVEAVTKNESHDDFHENVFVLRPRQPENNPRKRPRTVGKSCASRKHANTMTIGTAELAEVGLSEKRW